jgi:RNA polymerase sigma factor (sigma-70 family)
VFNDLTQFDPDPPIEIDAGEAVFTNLMTMYLRDVRRYQRLDAAHEAALVARLSEEVDCGDTSARDELICHHLGLVIAMARKFNHRGLDLLDLIEEGNLGMLVALQKFDPARGLRFSTYAAWWIRYYLQTAIATQVPIVRPPLRAQRRAGKQAWSQWCESHEVPDDTPNDALEHAGSEPGAETQTTAEAESESPGTLDATGGASPSNAVPMQAAALVTSLALHDEDIEAHFAAANVCHPDVIFEVAEHLDAPRLAALLRSLVADLPSRQRDVVNARFGLNGQDECSLQDLGAEQGVSRERMRQVQATALGALREGLARAGVDRAAALS